MDFKEIQELIKLINKTDLTEFKMEDGDFKISIRTHKFGKLVSQPTFQPQPQVVPIQQPAVQPPAAAPQDVPPAAPKPVTTGNQTGSKPATEEDENYIPIKSPIVGTFYRSSAPDKPPYIKVGDTIGVGDVVCIVEAMKLFNEIESEVSGKVVKVIAEDASPVEYDQVLFLIDPKG